MTAVAEQAQRWERGVVTPLFDRGELQPLYLNLVTLAGPMISGYMPGGYGPSMFVFTHYGPSEFHDRDAVLTGLYEAAATLGRWWRDNGYPYALGEGGRVEYPADRVTRLVCPLVHTGTLS